MTSSMSNICRFVLFFPCEQYINTCVSAVHFVRIIFSFLSCSCFNVAIFFVGQRQRQCLWALLPCALRPIFRFRMCVRVFFWFCLFRVGGSGSVPVPCVMCLRCTSFSFYPSLPALPLRASFSYEAPISIHHLFPLFLPIYVCVRVRSLNLLRYLIC